MTATRRLRHSWHRFSLPTDQVAEQKDGRSATQGCQSLAYVKPVLRVFHHTHSLSNSHAESRRCNIPIHSAGASRPAAKGPPAIGQSSCCG